ncbi:MULTISPECIES: helix-turn-helix domain-containing protein [Chryseobacterium]|uniref:Helix-turn-helix domain-containing protein n=1 Tax=Chryseobacterium bernardetii TaxID=1241978 RepID=A0A3G6TFR9_9FLAO|nr:MULTISPECIES: helix-turn-helix domain-containing protein [Chryseobacterium]AZB25074.1 helix-turn-helix domain-containing protein [Chryseobacterium bernardetii]UCA59530.1 helix-turn-helix domain-containing protein [Chryseobacterium rhizoplanae]
MTYKDIVFHNLHDLFKMIDKNADDQKSNNDFFIIRESHDLDENSYKYPFRTDNCAIMLITEGEGSMQINFEQINIKKDDLIIITPNSILHPASKGSYVRAKGIVFNDSFVQKNIRHMNYINEVIFFSERNTPILHPGFNERETLGFLIDKIGLAEAQDGYYSKDMINHYFNALLLELMVLYRCSDVRIIDPKTSRKKDLLNQFLVLLSEHSKKERTVEFYAEKLFVTPSYLTRIVKEASGESTRNIITNSVIIEARDMLLHSNLSITQIADKLNFSDQSFFGKFFKKKMKMSPKMFRTKMK